MPHLTLTNLLTLFPLCISSQTLLLEHGKKLLIHSQCSRQCLQLPLFLHQFGPASCPTLISSSAAALKSHMGVLNVLLSPDIVASNNVTTGKIVIEPLPQQHSHSDDDFLARSMGRTHVRSLSIDLPKMITEQIESN